MSSSRKYSIIRHIENYNINNGEGKAIPYVEYIVGRREGKYQSKQAPSFSRSPSDFFQRTLDKIAQEFENQIAKETAKRVYNDISKNQANQTLLNELMRVANVYITNKILRNL